MRAPKRISSS